MPISLRIPEETERLIRKAAAKMGKTKSGLILEAIHEKLGIVQPREKLVKDTAGWLSREEARELRESVNVFGEVDEDDWQ